MLIERLAALASAAYGWPAPERVSSPSSRDMSVLSQQWEATKSDLIQFAGMREGFCVILQSKTISSRDESHEDSCV